MRRRAAFQFHEHEEDEEEEKEEGIGVDDGKPKKEIPEEVPASGRASPPERVRTDARVLLVLRHRGMWCSLRVSSPSSLVNSLGEQWVVVMDSSTLRAFLR